MKFVCDRCKTRYSIGDDRVRGKILKIRCKNCANVITVRDGMSAPDDVVATDADESSSRGRGHKKTTLAPPIAHSAPAPAATVPAVKPPAALDEEWYVSIDGVQSGPFSLADAQRWVANKPLDGELHCWTEGFGDWLPVDKVSHFRGLRRKPVVQQPPPPMPRVPQRPSQQPARAPVAVEEEEPKPLFAATLASLESSARPAPEPARPKATPLAGVAAISTPAKNGKTGSTTALAAKANAASAPALPSPVAAPLPSPVVAKPAGKLDKPGKPGKPDKVDPNDRSGRLPTRPGVGHAAPAVPGFDRPGGSEDDAAKVEPAGFDRHAMPAATSTDSPNLFAGVAAAPAAAPGDGIDDDMEIGEVSRVVNLADIVRTPRKERAQTQPARRPSLIRTASVAKLADGTAAVPGVPGSAVGIAPPVDGLGYASGYGGAPVFDGAARSSPDLSIAAEVPLAPAPQVVQRRSMITLLVVAVLLVGSAGAVVVYILLKGDDTPITLSDQGPSVDSLRPDDPGYRNPLLPIPVIPPTNPSRPYTNHPRYPIGPITGPDKGPGDRPDELVGPNAPLKPEEVEDMYQKSNSITQRCWERAQKKDPYIIKDVKRVLVTLTVAADGGVSNVAFAGLPQDDSISNLGPCLQSMIKGWRFRATRDSLTARITMAFQ